MVSSASLGNTSEAHTDLGCWRLLPAQKPRSGALIRGLFELQETFQAPECDFIWVMSGSTVISNPVMSDIVGTRNPPDRRK